MRYDKEKIYDDQISPLMTKIIQICKDNQMQMLASFHLKEEVGDVKDEDRSDDQRDLACTTYLQFGEGVSYSEKIKDAYRQIYNPPFAMSIMITSGPK